MVCLSFRVNRVQYIIFRLQIYTKICYQTICYGLRNVKMCNYDTLSNIMEAKIAHPRSVRSSVEDHCPLTINH